MEEEFIARVQKNNRVQIPVLIRWKNKLKIGVIMKVRIFKSGDIKSHGFHARLGKSGRITIPKIVVETGQVQPKDLIDVNIIFE